MSASEDFTELTIGGYVSVADDTSSAAAALSSLLSSMKRCSVLLSNIVYYYRRLNEMYVFWMEHRDGEGSATCVIPDAVNVNIAAFNSNYYECLEQIDVVSSACDDPADPENLTSAVAAAESFQEFASECTDPATELGEWYADNMGDECLEWFDEWTRSNGWIMEIVYPNSVSECAAQIDGLVGKVFSAAEVVSGILSALNRVVVNADGASVS